MKTITDANLQELKEMLVADYARWIRAAAGVSDIVRKQLMNYEAGITFNRGFKYIKIVSKDSIGTSVIGFIVCSTDDKEFEYGALLKSASRHAPARNFARGNIFDLEKAQADDHIRWAGII